MLASYPRSGNLWLRCMLYDLLLGSVSTERVVSQMPYVGQHRNAPRLLANGGRVVKTHEPYQASYRRAIHLVRDPRDLAVSYFSFLTRGRKLMIPSTMDDAEAFDAYIDAFIGGRLDAHGTWLAHLRSWTDAQSSGKADVHTVRYEDLRLEPHDTLELIARWLDLNVTAADISRAVDDCSIDRMRNADFESAPGRTLPSRPPVINQGLVGGWRDVLSAHQAARFGVFADGLAEMGYASATEPVASPR